MYNPISVEVFTSAYSGALAGIMSGRPINDPEPNFYQHAVQVAGAFAQSFDAILGIAEPTGLQCKIVTTLSTSFFQGRYPNETFSTDALRWDETVRWLLGLISASGDYFFSQGISEGTCAAGTSGVTPATVLDFEPEDGNITFNGDGSAGAEQLGVFTIIELDEIAGQNLVYTLSKDTATGIRKGWMVYVSILTETPTTNTGSLSIKKGAVDPSPVVLSGALNQNNLVVILYFDGSDWARINSPFVSTVPVTNSDFTYVNVSDANHTFSGNPSGGQTLIFAKTIISAHASAGAARTFNFLPATAVSGWLVLLFLLGDTGSSIAITDNGVGLLVLDFSSAPNSLAAGTPVALVFNGVHWAVLANYFQPPS